MKKRITQFTLTLAAGLFFAACLTSFGQAGKASMGARFPAWHTYSLNADWSNTNNPNGVWSYNQNATPINTFQTFWWGQAGWGYLWLGDGCVIKGSYPAGMNDPWGNPLEPAHDWRPGDVVIHGLSIPYGGDTTFVNITWTSPADGTIDISGRAWDAEIFADRDMSWTLIVGGETVAQRSSVRGIYRKDKSATFSANRVAKHPLTSIQVTQGEVVEFRVAATTYYGHFLGLQEQIRFKAKAN